MKKSDALEEKKEKEGEKAPKKEEEKDEGEKFKKKEKENDERDNTEKEVERRMWVVMMTKRREKICGQ